VGTQETQETQQGAQETSIWAEPAEAQDISSWAEPTKTQETLSWMDQRGQGINIDILFQLFIACRGQL